jgi:hypothetical protein
MDYFIEDIGNISINNGLVRIDCVRRLPGENEGEVQLQNKGQVVLPLASFVRVQGALSRAAEEMVSRGILQRREAAEQAPATDEEVTAALESFEVDLDEDAASDADAEAPNAEEEKPKSGRRRSRSK